MELPSPLPQAFSLSPLTCQSGTRFVPLMLAFLLAACSESAAPKGSPVGDGDRSGDGDAADAGGDGDIDEDSDACDEGEEDECVCRDGSGVGKRPCVDGSFAGSTCANCAPPVDGSPCQPGRYTGEFVIPKYLPRAASLCGFGGGWGGSGQGTFQFTLGSGTPGAEFIDVVETESCLEMVTESEVDGGLQAPDVPAGLDAGPQVNDAGVAPITLGLEGTVDCATGELKGTLKGLYYADVSVCSGFGFGGDEDFYPIKGSFTAVYDPKTQTFNDGYIDLQEKQNDFFLGDSLGGDGTWQGKLDPSAPEPPQRDQCYDEANWTDFKLVKRTNSNVPGH